MDPQKKANEIKAFLKKGRSGKAYWRMVGDIGLVIEKAAMQPEMLAAWNRLDPENTSPPSAKKSKKRDVADMMKVSALLIEDAELHVALERYEPEQSNAALEYLKGMFEER